MRRVELILLLLAACGGSDGGDAKQQCRDAIAKIGDTPPDQRVVVVALACANAETGKCRKLLRQAADLDPSIRAEAISTECPVDGPRLLAAAAGEDTPADGGVALPIAPAKLTIHESGVDLDWNGLTLHLGKDCGPLLAAFDTSSAPRDTLTIVADRDVIYADVIAVMDCAKHRFANISLQDGP
jgi:hypothetical protein